MEEDSCQDISDTENIEQLDEVEELQTHVADVGKICKNERVTSRQSTGSTVLPGETTRQSTTSLVMPCVLNVVPTAISESRPEQTLTEQPASRKSLSGVPCVATSLKLPLGKNDKNETKHVEVADKVLVVGQADSEKSEKSEIDKSTDKEGKRKDSKAPMKSPSYRDTFRLGVNEEGIQRSPSANNRRSFLTQDDIQQLQQLAAKQDKDWGFTKSTAGNLGFLAGEVRQKRLLCWLFLEEPWESLRSSVFSSIMVLIILASIFHSIFMLRKSGIDMDSFGAEADNMDIIFNTIFIVDTIVRWWCHPLPLRFLIVPKNAIDVLSLVPFLLITVLRLPQVTGLSFLRWLRSYESFLRLLKLSRYFWGWQLLFHAILDSAKALVIPLLFLVLIVLFGSCTLYVTEALHDKAVGTADDESDVYERLQRDWVTIRSLPDSIHFSIICVLSLSTGPFYGLQAAAWLSRMVVVLLMLVGMLFMAMPIAIVGSCFSQTWFDQDRIVLLSKVRSRLTAQGYTPQDLQDVFDEVDEDSSGFIEFQEFRKMIKTFHLRSLNSAKCRSLFAFFDTDSDGVISFSDFALTLYPDLSFEGDEEEESESDDDEDYKSHKGSVLSLKSATTRASSATSGSGGPAPPVGSPVTMSVENSPKAAASSGRRRSGSGDKSFDMDPEVDGLNSIKSESRFSHSHTDRSARFTDRSSMQSDESKATDASMELAPKASNTSDMFRPIGSLTTWFQDKWSMSSKKGGIRKPCAEQVEAARQKKASNAVLQSARVDDRPLPKVVRDTIPSPGEIDYEIALQKLDDLKSNRMGKKEASAEQLDHNDMNIVNLDVSTDIVEIRRRLSDQDHPQAVMSMKSDLSELSAQIQNSHLTVPSGSTTIQAAVAHLERAIQALEKRMERRIDQLISLCVNHANGRAGSSALPFAPNGAMTPRAVQQAQIGGVHGSLPGSRVGSRKPSMLTDSVFSNSVARTPQTLSCQPSCNGSRRSSGGAVAGTGSRRLSTGTVTKDGVGFYGPDCVSPEEKEPSPKSRRLSAKLAPSTANSRRTSFAGNQNQARHMLDPVSSGTRHSFLGMDPVSSGNRQSFLGKASHD